VQHQRILTMKALSDIRPWKCLQIQSPVKTAVWSDKLRSEETYIMVTSLGHYDANFQETPYVIETMSLLQDLRLPAKGCSQGEFRIQ
jgi:hypothetical protein